MKRETLSRTDDALRAAVTALDGEGLRNLLADDGPLFADVLNALSDPDRDAFLRKAFPSVNNTVVIRRQVRVPCPTCNARITHA